MHFPGVWAHTYEQDLPAPHPQPTLPAVTGGASSPNQAAGKLADKGAADSRAIDGGATPDSAKGASSTGRATRSRRRNTRRSTRRSPRKKQKRGRGARSKAKPRSESKPRSKSDASATDSAPSLPDANRKVCAAWCPSYVCKAWSLLLHGGALVLTCDAMQLSFVANQSAN